MHNVRVPAAKSLKKTNVPYAARNSHQKDLITMIQTVPSISKNVSPFTLLRRVPQQLSHDKLPLVYRLSVREV
jgi:hypothetical protein